MNLHEYQAKKLLQDYGIPTPPGGAASSPEEAAERARELGGERWMVKAQVHAGGRGKAGGVRMAHGLEEVASIAKQLIGTRLVTSQTTAEGQPINTVLVEGATDIEREFYLSMLVDRGARRIAFMASAAGGMNIEEVAAEDPDAIVRVQVDPAAGLQPYQCRDMAFALGLDADQRKQLTRVLYGLYKLFTEKDLSLLELNPLITSKDGRVMALDAKINVDDSALYRQVAVADLHDTSQEDAKETRAKQHDLNYIALDGNIACMVNGAGLAMATMDLIKLHGGEPANFLDVGGGTTAERVAEAFKLILSDARVEAILVNIFGGIVRCDLIAEGIISAVREVGTELPVVVRLEGTNVEQGIELLDHSGLAIISAADLTDAATQVVAAVNGQPG